MRTETGVCIRIRYQLTQSSSGNGYEGLVQADDSGWLVTSLPYDENFHITADGKEIQPERVNTAFLGVRIPEGNHQVKIWYEAPEAGQDCS